MRVGNVLATGRGREGYRRIDLQTRPIADLRLHADAALVPDMRPDEWTAFLADVRERGIVEPVVVAGDTVLDGRHRYRAAKEAGLAEVPVREVALKGEEARDFTLRAAVLRRHLTDDQRAAIAARYAKAHPKPKGGDRRSGKAKGDQTSPRGGRLVDQAGRQQDHPARTEAALVFNVTPKAAEKAAALLAADPDLAEKVRIGEVTMKEAQQATKAEKKKHQIAAIEAEPAVIPGGRYRVIVADPPWPYSNRESDPTHRASCPYPSMSVADICALPVADHAEEGCILWLWTTNHFMHEAFHVAEAWGFEPKTILTWAKHKMGLGDWLRGQTEHCILAVRGRPIVALTNQTTILHANSGKHSEKPEEFYALVEALCPGSKLELFARKRREGWAAFGDEVRE